MADTQSAPYAAETIPQSSGAPSYGGGPGTRGPGGGSGGGSGGPTTAEDETKKPPLDAEPQQLSLSDQIAANFAALSGILGTGETTGGGYPTSVPSEIPQPKSNAWIFVLIGAAVVAYLVIKRKEENGK